MQPQSPHGYIQALTLPIRLWPWRCGWYPYNGVVELVKSSVGRLMPGFVASTYMRVRNHQRFVRTVALWLFAALSLLLVFARRTAAAAASPAHAATHFAIADFDGDSRPDFASVDAGQISTRFTKYWIEFRLSGGPSRGVTITGPTGGLQIASRDVNGDSFPDVIVTTVWTNTPVAVLLNDGVGNFTSSSPSEFQSAFNGFGTSWTPAADEIRDATALPLARYVPGYCRTECGPLAFGEILWRIVPGRRSASRLTATAPFIGRAPPRL